MYIRQLFSEIKKDPLQRALQAVSTHFAEIQQVWRKKLASLGIRADACNVLFNLTWESQYQNLRAANLESYRTELDRHGKILEKAGVSEADTAAALSFYFESCLPYLLTEDRKGREKILPLARLTALSQFATLSSYGAEWVSNWRALQDRERHLLSRDLHDDIGHNLLVLKLYLEMMTTDLKRGDVGHLESKLEEALNLVSYAVDSVRRLMLDLGPAMLAQFGFLQALRIYARQFTLRTGIRVQVDAPNPVITFPSSYETAIYRVLQGALSNVVQHSKARHVKVTLGHMRKSVLFMSIEDDGVGFDVAKTLAHKVFGLTAMRERVESLGGKFHIESWSPQIGSRKHGTRIELDLPLNGIVE